MCGERRAASGDDAATLQIVVRIDPRRTRNDEGIGCERGVRLGGDVDVFGEYSAAEEVVVGGGGDGGGGAGSRRFGGRYGEVCA